MKNALLYELARRTPSRLWLERRDVLRWMRRAGMLRRGQAPRERLERGQAPGHSEFAWRNAAGHLACNKPYHCFSKICCATILRYRNTTFISCQQMFLNAETLSMIPGFVREINHASYGKESEMENTQYQPQAPQRPPIRFLIAADCKCGSLRWRG